MRLATQRINTVEHEGHTLYMLPDLKFNSMMTTKNCMTPEPSLTVRMARARAAKAAKKAAGWANGVAGITTTPATTGGAPPPLGDGTPSALDTPTTEHLQTILRELGTMFSHATPRGQELVAQGLALLDTK